MKREVDILKQLFAAINRNDVQAMIRDFDPQIVRVEPSDSAPADSYRGIEEVRENVRRGRGSWAEGSCEPEKFLFNGGKVVVYVHARVRLKGATEWNGYRFADGFAFRDGKITEYRTFAERAQALEWAGIQDDGVGEVERE